MKSSLDLNPVSDYMDKEMAFGLEVYETIGLLKSPCDSGGSYFQYSHGNYVLRSSFAHVPIFRDLERLLNIGILGNELSCFEQFGKSVLQITGMTIDQTKILMQAIA